MLKKLVLLLAALVFTMSTAFAAAVDVNTADQTTLETIKGIGPVKSKAIIDERTKNGPFKNADDLARRVKGLGAKSVTTLETHGLTIGGSSAPPTAAGAKHEQATAATAPIAAQSSKKTVKPAPKATIAAASSPHATASASSAQASSKPQKKKKNGKVRAASAASGT
ncbi:ComEA family DNA-binding protein [Trinickia acidisoli]|uniref:ComEA family DNA-binding protein n=1 Tax=Trinickia acidisoli TaxID=2767482 RepID=UPI001A900489|nr:helix-hairpin-helix domain-containing protein [Trinickia acidisoli]